MADADTLQFLVGARERLERIAERWYLMATWMGKTWMGKTRKTQRHGGHREGLGDVIEKASPSRSRFKRIMNASSLGMECDSNPVGLEMTLVRVIQMELGNHENWEVQNPVIRHAQGQEMMNHFVNDRYRYWCEFVS